LHRLVDDEHDEESRRKPMKLVVLKGGDEAVPLRTPSGPVRRNTGVVAVSLPGQVWVLLNITPAVAEQLNSDARLLQHAGLADAQQRAVVLTDAQIDHITGLLSLREGPPIHLYATPAVFEELTHKLPVLPMLEHYCGVHWHVIAVAGECREARFRVDGLPGIEFTAIATEAPLPPHAARAGSPVVGDSIALAMQDLSGGQRFFCAGSLGEAGAEAEAWMNGADCVLVGHARDQAQTRDAVQAAQVSQAESDSLARLAQMAARRKLLMCRAGEGVDASAPQRAALARQGIELALDRMEIVL
jgi:pyrroloquinoline quinone biosynthesis protein B